MRRTKSSDSCCGPGSIWLNRRSNENAPVRIRLGGSLTGCGGTRSISNTILARLRAGVEALLATYIPARPSKLRPRRFGVLRDLDKLHRIGARLRFVARRVCGLGRSGGGVETARRGLQDRLVFF